MSKKNKPAASIGIIALLAVALASYVFKGYIPEGDDPEMAEESALGGAYGSPEGMSDDDMSDAVDELYDNSQTSAPLEYPRGGESHGLLVRHTGYALSFDTIHHNPFWVAWELTRQESKGRVGRADEFVEDPSIPSRHAVRPSTYSGSGYSRGHMCPAGDQKWSEDAMNESFYMSNMCPQTFELNKLWWDWLERAERQWAADEGSVYIVCGPIYDEGRTVKNVNKRNTFFVGIPHRFFKVILSTRKGHEKALAFVYRNDASDQPLESCLCTVDEVEALTGYDFFSGLADPLEDRLEAHSSLLDWSDVPQPEWK